MRMVRLSILKGREKPNIMDRFEHDLAILTTFALHQTLCDVLLKLLGD